MHTQAFKTIGIAAVTAEGAALCYQEIVAQAGQLLGDHQHPPICLYNANFALYHHALTPNNVEAIIEILLASIHKLWLLGADFVIIPANTVHYWFNEVANSSPLPLLNIIDIVADECVNKSYQALGILGTQMTMAGGLYQQALAKRNIQLIIPTTEQQAIIQHGIFQELILQKLLWILAKSY